MKRISLNKNWEYVEAALQNPLLVNLLQGWKKTDLPHDYAVEKGRDALSPAGLDEGFFQGAGIYYKKSFDLSEAAAGKKLYIEFEGVSGFTEVWVNKKFAAKHMNPYTSFVIDASEHADGFVTEVAEGAADLTLGELLENKKAVPILRDLLGETLASPMLSSMKGMSLKKLMRMGGKEISASAARALDAAVAAAQD